ncbi:Holliday junction resolvase RuvX [Candidatus Giovannonibacteria bacterium]|nr:Holliday junction resolvase RuvX [Candidatus Giovannonibacteria bacterium]
MARVLCLDYGEKKIGVAISDEEKNLAFPKTVIENKWEKFESALRDIVYKEDVSIIVVGLPLGFKNQETLSTKKARAFGLKINKILDIPVAFENELLSTKQVLKSRSAPGKMRDASAAALILENYLLRLKQSTSNS